MKLPTPTKKPSKNAQIPLDTDLASPLPGPVAPEPTPQPPAAAVSAERPTEERPTEATNEAPFWANLGDFLGMKLWAFFSKNDFEVNMRGYF